jgi:hypothetical protein
MQKTTKELSFDRRETFPDEFELKRVLGETYSAYQEILKLTEGHRREWKYYGTKFGWQLKVVRNGKALRYLTPLKSSFRLGFAVRDNERDTLLNSNLPAKAKQDLRLAKRYPEGYPVRLSVSRKSEMNPVRVVIKTLQSMRS